MIVILAVALFIFLIVIALNQDVLSSTSGQFETAKARAALDDIANTAELVYQQGVGSKSVVFITMPGNVQDTTASGNLLQIDYYSGGTLKSVYRTIDFTVSGAIPLEEGSYYMDIESLDGSVSISTGEIICGNNIKDGTDVCDGTDVAGETCISQGFAGGVLSCLADCSAYDVNSCTSWQTIFFEDFENNWGCYTTRRPRNGDNCAANNPWGNFDNCNDNNDYLFCTSDDGQEGSHTTRALQMTDWDNFDSAMGIFYSFDPRLYSDIKVQGYMAAAGIDAGEYCRIWVEDSDSFDTIYECLDNVPAGCEAGDSTPEANDYVYFDVDLLALSGINIGDSELKIHIGSSGNGGRDYCFWDGITIVGLS